MAIIVVSTDARWLRPCLTSVLAHAGDLKLDIVIADNQSTDDTWEMIQDEFPSARVVRCRNHGFGHANNRALLTCDARYVLFLNPDTEILEGSLEEIVSILTDRPEIGLVSVKQVTADGTLFPTIRHFPNAVRAFGEAIGSERLPRRPEWLGERVLDLSRYDLEVDCDWFTGAFMIARPEALHGAGIFDERFFLTSEEVDLAYRIKRAGWRVVHLPQMTILHHVHMGKSLPARMHAQYAFARRQYAEKHFSAVHRTLYLSLVDLRYRLRLLAGLLPGRDRSATAGAARALRALHGQDPPPFGEPPSAAVEPRTLAPMEDERCSVGER